MLWNLAPLSCLGLDTQKCLSFLKPCANVSWQVKCMPSSVGINNPKQLENEHGEPIHQTTANGEV